MPDPNVTTCCPGCGHKVRRYLSPATCLARWQCGRCGVVHHTHLGDAPGVSRDAYSALFDTTRSAILADDAASGRPRHPLQKNLAPLLVRWDEDDILVPRCCAGGPQYQYDASRDVFFCKLCQVEYARQELSDRRRDYDKAHGQLPPITHRGRPARRTEGEKRDAIAEVLATAKAALRVAEEHLVAGTMPVLDGPVVGYRAWAFDSKQWCLKGTGWDRPWPVQELHTAEHLNASHQAPYEDCDCGLYGLARFEHGAEWWYSGDEITGAIKAWADEDEFGQDRMFFHETGFRAQYAKIVLLALDEDWPRAKRKGIAQLAHEYGADTCKVEHLATAAMEHGQLVPDELLQWAAGSDLWTGYGLAPSPEMVKLAEDAAKLQTTVNEWMAQWRNGQLTANEVRRRMGFPD